jgi:hypothetical protein
LVCRGIRVAAYTLAENRGGDSFTKEVRLVAFLIGLTAMIEAPLDSWARVILVASTFEARRANGSLIRERMVWQLHTVSSGCGITRRKNLELFRRISLDASIAAWAFILDVTA